MNKRREPRIQADQSVKVTLFGQPDIRVSARIKNISGRGIGLEFERPVAVGAALKIELEDAMLLGEVIYCRQDETSFYVGAEIEQALSGLSELSRMVSAFAAPETPAPSGPQQDDAEVEGCHQSKQQTH